MVSPTPVKKILSSHKVKASDLPTKKGYMCKWCHKTLTNETYYLRHRCKPMIRHEEMQSPTGQAAWKYYSTWMRLQKRTVSSAQTFLDSKLFRTFINFTTFVRRVDLPNPDSFIRLMIRLNFQPTLWTSDLAYTEYLEFMDKQAKPLDQFESSLKTVLQITDEFDVDVGQFFEVIDVPEFIRLVETRRLSPWLLLFSGKFAEFFKNQLSIEQRLLIETIIRPEYWGSRFDEFETEVEFIRETMGELNL